MKIYLAADHAGFQLKEEVKAWLKNKGHEIFDEGAFVLDQNDDYPDFIKIAAKLTVSEPDSRALIFGKSGEGEAMVANRQKGIRATVYYGGNKEIVKLSREHNDANVLSLAGAFVSTEEAKEVIELWLTTNFSGDERHLRRINKIDDDTEAIFQV